MQNKKVAVSISEQTDNELIDMVARDVLNRYLPAFQELANGEDSDNPSTEDNTVNFRQNL